jgi:hypothetical protein
MSVDLQIIQEEDRSVEVIIRANTVTLQVSEFYTKDTKFNFDMTNTSHRQALKTLVECLQQQLDVHGG